ncbi:MAG: HDIG domain-containing protein [Desulfotalea sp.]
MSSYKIQQADIDVLKDQGMVAEDLEHSVQVAEKALEVASRMSAELDMELIGRGALFHDLGKTDTHGITHGLLGAEKGEKLGLPPEVNAIMEKHIRGGLTEPEAIELGLPVKDYTLHLLEERVVIYADRLTDIIHDGVIAIDNELDAETHFKEILRDEIKYGKNDITTERYFRYHDEIQGLMAQD